MIGTTIKLKQLRKFINAAFDEDEYIVCIYDPSVPVQTVEDVCKNVYDKIKTLIAPYELIGISDGGNPIGYLVRQKDALISFGLNKEYRNNEGLKEFWDIIRNEMGDNFQCALFSINQRGIGWLKRQGMDVLFENITILTYSDN